MANLKGLAKDTAIYGLSSIVGRFLNYLLVPLYTNYMPKDSGDYGVSVNIYAYTALVLVVLTFGMETTLFRFANKADEKPDTVFTTALATVGLLSVLFLLGIFGFIEPLSHMLEYDDHPEYLQMMAVVVALDALQAIPFSYLRFQQQALKFAAFKLLFIVFNIVLNVFYFVVLGRTEVFYVFGINLFCTAFITFFFVPDLLRVKWRFDFGLLRRMLSYSWPILVLGIAGILNQTADKIIYPLVSDAADDRAQLGVYGACVKVAMIMAMITQAFRYAYEPLVFAKAKDRDSKEYYAQAMKYFIVFTLLAFLAVMGYMDLLKHIIDEDYREAIPTIPVVMAAEIMMGIYFNLSFWYKLIDKTIWGAWFSLAGCVVLVAINVIFIPRIGYWACAWGGFAGYATSMLLSYFVGQQKNPIRYPMRDIALYTLLAGALYVVMTFVPETWHPVLRMTVNTLLLLIFVAYIVWKDMPLSTLPFVGKYFRKVKS
ncbi:MAG: lipopolysaccharide biosynthesis protein [Bacteroidales bacterium]|nr:lipopolysaccharide biosynthesis protein [Bacteroidales bacterium]